MVLDIMFIILSLHMGGTILGGWQFEVSMTED